MITPGLLRCYSAVAQYYSGVTQRLLSGLLSSPSGVKLFPQINYLWLLHDATDASA